MGMMTDVATRTRARDTGQGGLSPRTRSDARTTARWGRDERGRNVLSGDGARPLRFALTGGIAGLVQLTLLALLTRHGWPTLPANCLAFLLAAQLNFALSSAFTWRDRVAGRSVGRLWLGFHASIAGMAVVNMLVFAAARAVVPTLAASLLGIGVAAVGNFVVGDRLVFRGQPGHEERAREVAA